MHILEVKKTLQISKCDIIKGSFRFHAYFGSCLQNSETTLIVTSTKTMNRILGKHFFKAGFILQAKGNFTSTH